MFYWVHSSGMLMIYFSIPKFCYGHRITMFDKGKYTCVDFDEQNVFNTWKTTACIVYSSQNYTCSK